MGRLAFAVAVLVGMAFCPGAGADDGSALAERLGSQLFDESTLQNRAHLVDIGSTGTVADDLRPYGLVGVAFVSFRGRDGIVATAYYVFSSPTSAEAFPAQYIADLRQTDQPTWWMELPISMADPERGDIAGNCIATDKVEHITCLFGEPSGLPVVIQISPMVPDLPAGISEDEAKNLVGQRAGRATQDVMTALRLHLAKAVGGSQVADNPPIETDVGVIMDRLQNAPFNGHLLGDGYRYMEAFSIVGDGVPQGWDMEKMIVLNFDGPAGQPHAGYMVFRSNEAARTFYQGYPSAWKRDVSAQGWAETLEVVGSGSDPLQEFRVPCIASAVDAVTACLDDFTGTPFIIEIDVPTPAVDGLSAEERVAAIAERAQAVVAALLPAARERAADAMLPPQ